MNIVVLNECFLSEDNVAYLKSIGDVEIFSDTTTEEKAIARMTGKDIVLSDMYECPLNTKVLAQSARTKLLCVNSTGFDRVDIDTAALMNMNVANTPGFSNEAVAEHTFGLLLSLARNINEAASAARRQPFQIDPGNPDHLRYIGFNLSGKTLGLVGVGAIGAQMARIANGFGMHVIGHNRTVKVLEGVEFVSRAELLRRSDVISIHCSFNPEAVSFIDADALTYVKPGVIILNTARGACVVSKDLADGLRSGQVARAGLDDLDDWHLTNPLFADPRALITPHMGWFTQESLARIGDIMTMNVRSFVEGRPQNIVSVSPRIVAIAQAV